MSHRLISHNKDLKKLQDDGYELQVKGAFLVISSVPYVNSKRQVIRGTLICKLNLVANELAKPEDHVMYFIGEHPCSHDGAPMTGLVASSNNSNFGDGIEINHTFSAKPPPGNYPDYYEKVTTYVKILGHHAVVLDESATAKTFKPIESYEKDDVFHYIDTNSSRAEINALSLPFENLRVAIRWHGVVRARFCFENAG
jgi:hypothetical protein